MHFACVLGMIFPLSELSAWKGRQSQLPGKKHAPNALKAFFKWAACIGLLCCIPQEGLGQLEQDAFGLVLRNRIWVCHAGVS